MVDEVAEDMDNEVTKHLIRRQKEINRGKLMKDNMRYVKKVRPLVHPRNAESFRVEEIGDNVSVDRLITHLRNHRYGYEQDGAITVYLEDGNTEGVLYLGNPSEGEEIILVDNLDYSDMDAESFEADKQKDYNYSYGDWDDSIYGVQIYDTDMKLKDVKKMLKDAGIKTKKPVAKLARDYGFYFIIDKSQQNEFEKAFKKYGMVGSYEYEAESFDVEGEFEFQVYAFIDDDDDDEWGDPIGQPMPEKSYLSGSDEFHYIGFDSIEECKKYIKDLPKGWSGYIEVIVYDKEDFSKVRPEVISYEEYQKNMGAESEDKLADLTNEDLSRISYAYKNPDPRKGGTRFDLEGALELSAWFASRNMKYGDEFLEWFEDNTYDIMEDIEIKYGKDYLMFFTPKMLQDALDESFEQETKNAEDRETGPEWVRRKMKPFRMDHERRKEAEGHMDWEIDDRDIYNPEKDAIDAIRGNRALREELEQQGVYVGRHPGYYDESGRWVEKMDFYPEEPEIPMWIQGLIGLGVVSGLTFALKKMSDATVKGGNQTNESGE